MPIYCYQCECGKKFEKLFSLMSKGEPFLSEHPCECGLTAERTFEGRAPLVLFNFIDAPVYSSNANPNKQ